jgi:hypothetical protein
MLFMNKWIPLVSQHPWLKVPGPEPWNPSSQILEFFVANPCANLDCRSHYGPTSFIVCAVAVCLDPPWSKNCWNFLGGHVNSGACAKLVIPISFSRRSLLGQALVRSEFNASTCSHQITLVAVQMLKCFAKKNFSHFIQWYGLERCGRWRGQGRPLGGRKRVGWSDWNFSWQSIWAFGVRVMWPCVWIEFASDLRLSKNIFATARVAHCIAFQNRRLDLT